MEINKLNYSYDMIHLVDSSLWPILLAFSLFFFLVGTGFIYCYKLSCQKMDQDELFKIKVFYFNKLNSLKKNNLLSCQQLTDLEYFYKYQIVICQQLESFNNFKIFTCSKNQFSSDQKNWQQFIFFNGSDDLEKDKLIEQIINELQYLIKLIGCPVHPMLWKFLRLNLKKKDLERLKEILERLLNGLKDNLPDLAQLNIELIKTQIIFWVLLILFLIGGGLAIYYFWKDPDPNSNTDLDSDSKSETDSE